MSKPMLPPCSLRTLKAAQSGDGLYVFLQIQIGTVRRFALYVEEKGEMALELMSGERDQAEQDFLVAVDGAIAPCHLKDWSQDRSRCLAQEI